MYSEGRSLDGWVLFSAAAISFSITLFIVLWLHEFGLIKFEDGGKLTESEIKRMDGLEAYMKGEDYYLSKEYGKSFEHLNRAIELDYMRDTAYEFRSVCHEELGSLKKAAEDLNSAISLRPNDANLYFQRSNIKNKGKDFQGSVTDLQEAIRLSKLDNETNEKYRELAQELGHKDHTSMYEASLHMAKLRIWRESRRKTET